MTVPDAVAPPPRHPRFPLIDGLRAIAVLAVVGVHAAQFGGADSGSLPGRLLSHLNVGVTIFFLISGFLLYRPFIAHRGGGPSAPAVGDYAKRRFLRIYPAYWAAVTILLLVPGITVVVGGNWLSMYSMTHTLGLGGGPLCSALVNTCGLAQTWSLVVELTFYIALPLYAIVAGRLTARLTGRAWMAAELALLALLSIASVLVEFVVLWPAPRWVGWSVTGNVLWFAFGMAAAVLSVGSAGALRHVARFSTALWVLALAAYVALCLWLPPTPFLFRRDQQLLTHLVFGGIAALLLAPAVFAPDPGRLVRGVLRNPVMAWLGLISYGIFLWHYAVALKLGAPGAGHSFGVVLVGMLAISIACAAVSYYVIERPLLRLKYHRLRELVRSTAA